MFNVRSSLFCDVMQQGLVVSYTDISGQSIGLIFRGQAVSLDCLNVEDVAKRLFRNTGNYQSMLYNITEVKVSFTPWWKPEITCSTLCQTVFLILNLAFSVDITENLLLGPSQRNKLQLINYIN